MTDRDYPDNVLLELGDDAQETTPRHEVPVLDPQTAAMDALSGLAIGSAIPAHGLRQENADGWAVFYDGVRARASRPKR
jgi:hypothetical protein